MADKSDNKIKNVNVPSPQIQILVICPSCGFEETVHVQPIDLSDLIIQQFLLTNDDEIEVEIIVKWNCSHCGAINEIGGDYEDCVD